MVLHSFFLRALSVFVLFGFLSVLPGCAGILPVPGGDETTNKDFYKTDQELLDAISKLRPGMAEDEVFSVLEREESDFVKLDRSDIVKALFGGSDVELEQGLERQGPDNHLLQSLYGYRFSFKVVEREHGFSSPIRIRTHESGYSYTVYLIFKDGALYEKPIISGGVVNNTSSGTLFDYLTPSTVIKHSIE